MQLRLKQTLSVVLAALIIACNVTGLPVLAKSNDDQIRDNITRTVLEMEAIMERSYENAKEKLSDDCHDGGYDYELSLESFNDQGTPFSNYDYERFIAAYATIQEYCMDNGMSMGEGINQIDFVTYVTEEAQIEEYIPEVMDKYVSMGDGIYKKDGTYYLTEPTEVGIYEENDDGNYIMTGTEVHDLKKVTTKYLEVTLSVASLESIYETFGLDRKDHEDTEEKRHEAMDRIMGKANLDQTTFLQRGLGLSEEDEKIINEAIAMTDVTIRKQLIQIAASIIGKVPYEWGGKSDMAGFDNTWYTFDENGKQKGLDCSGYVQWILRTAGYDNWDRLVGTNDFLSSKDDLYPISASDLQPGDFGLFYPDNKARTNHIGMYLGDGYWIHCSSTANTVTISNNSKFSVYRRLNLLKDDSERFIITEVQKDDETTNETSFAIVAESSVKKIDDKKAETKKEEKNKEKPVETTETQEAKEVKKEEKSQEVTPAPETEVVSEPEPEAEPVQETIIHIASNSSAITYTESELILMTKIVMCEAQAEGYNGWVGVAQVIRNRILSPYFAQTSVEGVVSANKQFSTYKKATRMSDGDINQDIYLVCRKVLDGELRIFPSDEVIGFKRTSSNDDNWNGWHKYSQMPTIGNHSFYVK